MAAIDRFVNRSADGTGNGTTNATTGGTGAFTTLSNWLTNTAGAGGAADDYSVLCSQGASGSSDTTGINIDLTTDLTTGTVLVAGHPSDPNGRYFGNATQSSSHYRLVVNGTCLRAQENNVTYRGLQVEQTNAGGFTSVIRLDSSNFNNLTVEYCRFRYFGRSVASWNGSNPAGRPTGGTNHFRNNIMVNAGANASGAIDLNLAFGSAMTLNIRQNTFYLRSSEPAVRIAAWTGAAAQSVVIENNIVANTTAPFALQANTGSLVITTNYNWTDDGTAGTTNEQNLPAHGSTFTSAGSGTGGDFSLLQALATAGQVGSIADDITGAARGSGANCDAGAFERADGGGGGGITGPLIGGHLIGRGPLIGGRLVNAPTYAAAIALAVNENSIPLRKAA